MRVSFRFIRLLVPVLAWIGCGGRDIDTILPSDVDASMAGATGTGSATIGATSSGSTGFATSGTATSSTATSSAATSTSGSSTSFATTSSSGTSTAFTTTGPTTTTATTTATTTGFGGAASSTVVGGSGGNIGTGGAGGAAGGPLGGAPPDATVLCNSAPIAGSNEQVYCKKLVKDPAWSCSCNYKNGAGFCTTTSEMPCGAGNCCGIDTTKAKGCAATMPTIKPFAACGGALPRLCPHVRQVNTPNYGPFTSCCPATAPFSCPNGTPNSCFPNAEAARMSCGDDCVQCQ